MGKEYERIAELEALLKAALNEIEQLKVENSRLKETIARLGKNSGNSSKPPSSDIVKPPQIGQHKGKRKIGAQKGHERHLRAPFDERQVDTIIDLTLSSCPTCGGVLQTSCEKPKKYQQVSLAEKPLIITEYRQHRYWCEHCQSNHVSRLPREVKRSGFFDQNLIGLTAYMKGRCHMSYQTMADFYADALSVKVSTGFLAKQVHKASLALKEPYEHLVEQLPKAGHVHVDETSGKENGESRWTWCLRGNDFTVFHIAPTRSSLVLESLLGKDYEGIISSDFHSVYKKFKRRTKARLQLCWAHLIRDVKFIAEYSDGAVSGWGKRLLEQIRGMFSVYHRRNDLYAGNWRRKMYSCKASILKIALDEVPSHKVTKSLSTRFKEWQEEYFRFIDEGVPPTNNLCEQSLRTVVIDRRITYGTRGERGNRWNERIWTIVATCKQRGENVLLFLRSCVGAFLQGFSPPLFLIE